MTDVRSAVAAAILRIAERKQPELRGVEPNQHLIEDLQLDSLDIAELVATLEMTLNIDPFSSSSLSITDCPTVEALCSAYAT